MEIDITDLFEDLKSSHLILFSATASDLGEDAGSITWANCLDRASEPPLSALLTKDDEIQALKSHVVGYGAWAFWRD